MDEVDYKALVAAYKQLGGELSLDLIQLSIGCILLPVLHVKVQDVVGAVYIGNVCMAEHDILSSGHDVQRFLRGGNMVCGPCQDFCQAVKVYGLNQIVERIEVKCLPIKVFAGCQKDQKRIFVQPANAACSVYTVLTGQIYIKQKYIKLLLPVFHIEQQRFRAGICCLGKVRFWRAVLWYKNFIRVCMREYHLGRRADAMTILRDKSIFWGMFHVILLFIMLFRSRFTRKKTMMAAAIGMGILMVANGAGLYRGRQRDSGAGGGNSAGNSGGTGAGTSKAPGTGKPKVKQEKKGNIQKEVRVEGTDTLDAAVETPLSELADMVLTKEEKQKAAGGTDVKIVLEVKDASAVVSAADKVLVEKALNGSQARHDRRDEKGACLCNHRLGEAGREDQKTNGTCGDFCAAGVLPQHR